MGQYTSYYLYQKYESRGGQTPTPCSPSIYSIDADGTMQKVIKLDNDPDCGYTPPPTEPIYRWYQIPITQDYICASCGTIYRWVESGTTCVGYDKWQRSIQQYSEDNGATWHNVTPPTYSATSLIEVDSEDCGYVPPTPTGETIYRWVESDTTCVGYDKWQRSIQQYSEDGGTTWHNTNPPVYSATSLIEVDSTDCGVSYRWINLNPSTDYYCSGTTKYYKQQKQKSYDGSTWENVTPAEYQWGGTAETESTDCGYVPPIPTEKKFIATYTGGTTREVDCNDNATLTSGETQPSGYNASAMTSAVISDCVSRLDHYVFKDCISLSAVSIPNEVSYIGWWAFTGCGSLTSINIPNGVTRINNYTFLRCINLKRINSNVDGVFNIPSGVTYIGDLAFQDCHNLTSIKIPSGVTTINTQTFYYCTGLTSVIISDSVTSIGNAAFHNCKSLTSVTIPNSVTSIGDSAFGRCSGLTSITVEATTPPALDGTQVFDDTGNCPIYVPAASVSSYQSASGWSEYANRIQAIP